jgi:hypothetical protein
MATATFGNVGGRIDARPVRPTSNQTPWDDALRLRDEIARAVRSTLEQEAVEAAVFVSVQGNYPPWVKLEAWLPGVGGRSDTGGCERAELEFIIDVKPYHEHEIVVSANLTRGKTKIAVKARPDFPVRYVAEWVRFALGRGPKPANYTPKLDAFMSFIASLIPFLPAPHRNRLRREYRTLFTGAMALGLVALLLFIIGAQMIGGRSDAEILIGLLMIVAAVACLVAAGLVVRFRKRAVSVTPQSLMPPRNLGLVDSWNAVVAELGRDFANVKRRLINAIVEDPGFGITSQIETYTHRAPNGYEQRERLVIAKDQGMVHVHIYQFGHDLFVGWHAYLNWAQWGETNPVSTKIRERQEVEFRDLRPTVYVPSQFDLIDLSSLSEFVHRRIEREIKAMLKERAIDQEIDFKVIRGDRDRALDEDRHTADDKKRTGWSYRSK